MIHSCSADKKARTHTARCHNHDLHPGCSVEWPEDCDGHVANLSCRSGAQLRSRVQAGFKLQRDLGGKAAISCCKVCMPDESLPKLMSFSGNCLRQPTQSPLQASSPRDSRTSTRLTTAAEDHTDRRAVPSLASMEVSGLPQGLHTSRVHRSYIHGLWNLKSTLAVHHHHVVMTAY